MVEIRKVECPKDKYAIKCPYAMTPTRVVIHNTANDAPAENEIAYMHRNGYETSFHFAVDDKEIVQGIDLNRNAWHASDGNGKGNREGIAIEICYSKSGGERFVKAQENAAELTAHLLKQYGWGVDRVTKHGDYTNKHCPHRTLDEYGWEYFISLVKKYLGEDKEEEATLKAGDKLKLKGVPMYASSTTKTVSSNITGTYYVWSDEVVKGRIRITNSSARVGVAGQVTGWVNVSDVSATPVKAEKVEAVAKKTNEEIAKEVLAGKWGNGTDRRNRLTKAGYDYDAVQAIVDDLCNGKTTQTVAKKSVAELATEVIVGKWGNGTDRIKRLTEAGYDYDAVQAEVDRRYN